MASDMNYIAAPILKQRGIQLAHLECTFDVETSSTVYTATSACGKIGAFSIPATIFCDAHRENTVADLLAAHFKSMEFSDGQSAVSEVQPESAHPEADTGQPEQDQKTVNVVSAASQGAVDAGGPPSQTQPAWQEQGS
jgi:hypothetical protein